MNKYIIIIALFTVSCAKKVEPTYGVEGNYKIDYEIIDGVRNDFTTIYSLEIDEDNFMIHSDTGSSAIYPYYLQGDSLYIVIPNDTVVHHYKASKDYLELTKYYPVNRLITVFNKRL